MAVNANDAALTGLATARTGSTAGHPASNAPAAGSFDLILQAAAGSVCRARTRTAALSWCFLCSSSRSPILVD